MFNCYLCREESLDDPLDFGMQSLCNRFLQTPVTDEYLNPLVIGQCDKCGLIQNIEPVPAEEMKPRFDWIVYSEPEQHLDEVVDAIIGLPGISRQAKFCGISIYDAPLLKRIEERGFHNIRQIDKLDDLGITDPIIGLETIQNRINEESISKLVEKNGRYEVVIARFILEHAHDLSKFIEGLKKLVSPSGYLIIEVPDCSLALAKGDYSVIWEEHILYYTLETFRRSFSFSGFSCLYHNSYPNSAGGSIVGVFQHDESIRPSYPGEEILKDEKQSFRKFAEDLPDRRNKLKSFLREFRRNKGGIAMFGAGHCSCSYMNLLEVSGYIDFVVDDDQRKQGLSMPGSRLPIYGSDMLLKENIQLCLLSVSPDSEEKIIKKNSSFVDKGGMFASIYPASEHALSL